MIGLVLAARILWKMTAVKVMMRASNPERRKLVREREMRLG